ncbi:MAG: hypothetical protein RBR29_01770 [Castellaniella sp.]|uniref:pilus assembly FimT family protein n=1 Tax=Castellaniella sp. TaxID=1955812 RepID=UPI002A36D683|nr:hypothetical protein [Castellaniella sp.]MDY0308508.1 hypothetical protein [Castellaniella sp.]
MSVERLPDRGHQRQRGSLLLEFMVVAILGLALAVWAGQEWAQRIRALQARSLAAWMQIADDAAEGFLARHAAAIALAEAPDALAGQGFANWAAPSWDELQAAGLLARGWQAQGPLHRTLGLKVMRDGVCPGTACRVWALTHARPALRTAAGGVDEALVAEWLQAAEGRGLVVWPHRPGALSGAGWRVPVPTEGGDDWQPGVVALAARPLAGERGDHTPGETDAFLRVGDARDPDFQGVLTVRGVIRSGTHLAARDSLQLERGWGIGEFCAPEGALGRARDGLGMLACRQGLWSLLARPAGGGYMLNSRRGCRNAAGDSSANPVTGACACPAGYVMVQVAESGSIMAPEGLSMGFVCLAQQ